jgi:hypothetical protein
VTSARGAVWIEDAAGLALDGAPLSGAIPVVSDLVLEARVDAVLEPVERPAAAVSQGRWRDGVQALGAAVLGGLSRQLSSAGDQQQAILELRREAERRQTARVFEDLANVV